MKLSTASTFLLCLSGTVIAHPPSELFLEDRDTLNDLDSSEALTSIKEKGVEISKYLI